MATITRTSDRERERLRRSAIGADQGPNAEQQADVFHHGNTLEIGDPQDPTNVTFPFLRRMRRDHMMAMGLHFIEMPLVSASWYMEADDARVAAFADNLIRPIFGRLMLLLLRMLSFGYSPGAKNFDVVNPGWTYLPGIGQDPARVWDQGGVGAMIYKPVIPLRPENAVPLYRNGNFVGIGYDSRYGGAGYFLVNGERKPDIDLLHAVWAVHDQDNEDGCQPPGEKVLTTKGYVPIQELDPEKHKLVSYNPAQSKIHRGIGSSPKHKGYGFEVFTRPHKGDMLEIKTLGGTMRCTPNHKLTVRWAEQARDQWAVYLMRRDDDWRVGTTKIINQKSKQTNSGVGARMQREGATEGWILKVCETRAEALLLEALYSNQYGVPDMCFKASQSDSGLTQEDVDAFWAQIDSVKGAKRLLAACKRELSFPLYKREEGKQAPRQSGRVQFTIHAANLIPGSMEMPTDPGEGMRPVWHEVSLDRYDYDGVVYSLQVDPYKHYVSGGVITRNSPFGFPRIAHAAPIFHMYRYIWTLLGRAFENNADPGPVVRYPTGDLPASVNGKQETNVQIALRIGRRRRSGSTVALPSDPYTDFQDKPTGKAKWDIEYPKSETNFDQIINFLGFLESAKLRALWLQEQGIIEGSGGQSNRNVASEFGDQRDASQIVLMQQLVDVIEQQFLAPAMAMNMPWYEGNLKMRVVGFSSDEDEVVRQILQLAGQQDLSTFGVDVRRILESKGMPMLSPADYKKVQEDAAKKAEQSVTPAVEPTQGRRALVTQTGFSRETGQPEMTYVQLGGSIELDADGDFVAALPKTDAFADRQVVATTRELRKTAVAFLTWAYGDFARYLGKQKTLDLAELLDEVAREHFDETGTELADGDKVRKAVDRLMGGWRPSVDKLSDFSKKTRAALGRVYDRTSGIHLERLRSSAKVSATDKAAAAWLDARGAETVSSVLETTREQLAQVLADGVRAGKTPKQIAKDIREHFDGFPASRAAMIARTEVSAAYNYATVTTGMAAGVTRGQILDGNEDAPCKQRNGKIVTLADALKEKLAHPNCTLTVRLLPRASANFDVRVAPLEGLQARFDVATETVLLSPDIAREDEARYLIALGDVLAATEDPAAEPVAV